jgi:hypothetical protein
VADDHLGAAEAIARFSGHIFEYLGRGMMVIIA